MAKDYSDSEDTYHINAEYTSQSADQKINTPSWHKAGEDRDVRGNSCILPRSIPTQEEADRIKYAL